MAMIKILLSRKLGEIRMTQKELATVTGIRPNTIGELYHELVDKVSLEQLDKICEALDCQPGDLLEYVPDEYPEKYYYLGMLEERNYSYEAAYDMYETGIDKGSLLSLLGMGNLYLNGYGVDRDVITAKEYFDNALFAGCIEANYYEALIWEKGLIPGEEPDHEKALEYIEALAEIEKPIVTGAVHSEPEILARAYVLQGDIYAAGNGGPDKTATSASLATSLACSFSRK